jgi:hypothetical protein
MSEGIQVEVDALGNVIVRAREVLSRDFPRGTVEVDIGGIFFQSGRIVPEAAMEKIIGATVISTTEY